ncbi:CopG family transcriptional regulator [Haloarcula marismortui ATCC 33799]|uniref:CopG family transcriptional regulator n=1 Tax=Haloarcula marismortui ATCC 33799 TaxID=662475 RepID=M0K8E1_9EURY|nr:CopG family transcriptional regulator [Haloarcula californiae ATCC 33799]
MRTTVVGDGMARRFTIVCDDDQARIIETLARRYGITEEEVLSQLVELGLEVRDEQTV